jgi:hypothetical protein
MPDIERDAKNAAGDLLQSSASRLAEYVLSLTEVTSQAIPYEVHMAALEARDGVIAWTEVRRRDAR